VLQLRHWFADVVFVPVLVVERKKTDHRIPRILSRCTHCFGLK